MVRYIINDFNWNFLSIVEESLRCTAPQKLDIKNLTFGVFLMKLTYEDKIEIYQLRKQGESLKNLSKKYDIADSNIKYLVRLIDQYGIEIVKKEKNVTIHQN